MDVLLRRKGDAGWHTNHNLGGSEEKCRLNEGEIRMAKKMGLNPKSLIKNIPSPREQWKHPVKIWIREIYEERHRNKENRTGETPYG